MIMSWHIYLRKGSVFIPTVARTEAGYFMDIEPVLVIEHADAHKLSDGIRTAIRTGNPIVPTPSRSSFPEPVVLKYAGVKSWSTFERNAHCWMLEQKDSVFTLHSPDISKPEDWNDSYSVIQTFSTEDALDELIKVITEQITKCSTGTRSASRNL